MDTLKNKIKLVAYDFDGVMTDNKVYVDQDGKEIVQVNRGDGLGISEIKKLGIEQIIISTEQNPVHPLELINLISLVCKVLKIRRWLYLIIARKMTLI